MQKKMRSGKFKTKKQIMSSSHQDVLFALIDLVADFRNLLSCIISHCLPLLSDWLAELPGASGEGFSYKHRGLCSLQGTATSSALPAQSVKGVYLLIQAHSPAIPVWNISRNQVSLLSVNFTLEFKLSQQPRADLQGDCGQPCTGSLFCAFLSIQYFIS